VTVAYRRQPVNIQVVGDVHVPSDFMGMCFIRYPLFGSSPVGALNYGSVRLSQTYGTRWADIETSPGVYDWSQLDQIITFQRSHGKSVYYGFYATPRFYADNSTPNPIQTDYNTRGAWGSLFGEGANPTSLEAVASFCTAAISRYNAPGGVWYDQYGSLYGKGIQYWETWNEPSAWTGGGGHGTIVETNRSTRFGWHTPAQLVDLHVTQYAAIKSVDASVQVSTPGFHASVSNYLASALATVGPLTGVSLGNATDAVAWHPYRQTPFGWQSFSNRYQNSMEFGADGVIRMRAACAAAGFPDLPLWANEWGVDDGQTSDEIVAWNAAPPRYRRKWIAQSFASMAILGVKRLDPWHWLQTGAVTNAGNYQQDVDGALAGYNDAAANLPGRTIVSADYYHRDSIRVQFSSGPEWIV
jgi:hypothetical protein